MNVQGLVNSAIYRSLQDRQHQADINSGYAEFALTQLNLILDGWRDYIPFPSETVFNNVTNLENSRFVSIENVNYIVNKVSFPVTPVTLDRYQEQATVEDLIGFTGIYYFDPLNQTIMVYPKPSNVSYQFRIWGRLSQIDLGMFDELPANMPLFMQDALVFELAYRLASEYSVPWDDKKEEQRQKLIQQLIGKKKLDLSYKRNIVFGSPNSNSLPIPYLYYLSGGQ